MITVTLFAKKTGDYSSLSSVDLRLIALTYQLECELGPERGTHLRTEPCPTVSEVATVCVGVCVCVDGCVCVCVCVCVPLHHLKDEF